MPGEDEKITIRVPKRFLQAIDFLVEMDDFPTRSEAVRAALRDFVYGRVEIVTEKIKKMQAAEVAMAEADRTRREFLRK
jgi:Arc/MetJ-type ribon-helix-helix transcriptional regulator